jgi:8-oxo-dGTP pyrophosphatase MutT (NUDIX family)
MKLVYKIATRFRKLFWYIFRPKTFGVKCLIEHNGKYLFIKNSYQNNLWNIPGGEIKKHEIKEKAIRREVFEELRIDIKNLKYIGEYTSTLEYKEDTVYCFYAYTDSDIVTPSFEIDEFRWFDKNTIPSEVSNSIKKSVRFLL